MLESDMFTVELDDDDFADTQKKFVWIGCIHKAINAAKNQDIMGAEELLRAERKMFGGINAAVQLGKLTPLDPVTLNPLSIEKNDYGLGIVLFAELVEWGHAIKLYDFVRAAFANAMPQAAPVAVEQAATEMPALRQQRQDALAVELDTILNAMEKPTPTKVMAKLREQIGKPNTCIIVNVGEGIQWERDNGDVETLKIAALGERIKNWKRKNQG